MSAVIDTVPSSTSSLSGRMGRASSLVLLCGLVVAVAVLWQMRWGTVPDTSWLITACERVLAGERLYIDFHEVNPPFTLWMFLPVVAFAKTLHISPEICVQAYSYLICIMGLGFAAFIAQLARFAENRALVPLLPVFLAVLVVLPGNSFAEREHLGVALLLPLLVLTAWRSQPNRVVEPGWTVAILAGLCGSVLVLVKPYYAIVILAPALYMAWCRRSIRPLFFVEYWVIGAVSSAYLLAVVEFYPEFLRDIYPLLADTYMRVTVPWIRLLQSYAGAYLIGLYMLRFLRPGVSLSPLIAVFTIASMAAVVPYFYQAKGWAYHAYPAISLLLVALILRLAQEPAGSTGQNATAPSLSRKLLLALVIGVNALPFLPSQKPSAELVAAIRAATDRPAVGLIGSDIAAGHPLARMVDGRWLSAFCSDWLGAFETYLGRVDEVGGNPERAAHYAALTERYIEVKLAEFQANRPDLLIFQKEDTLWTRRLLDRDDFARLLSDYHFLTEDPSIRVYVRNGHGPATAGEGS